MRREQPNYGRTFPMYVPGLDWYFLSDDHPEYPMVFYLDLDFSGQLDQQRMSEALEEALYRHPLLFCVVQKAKQNRLCWVPAPDKMPKINWADESVPVDFESGDYIDIRNQTGLRIWVRQSDSGAKMTLQFHHAACDGTGAYRFVGDLLGCYMKRLDSCADKVALGDFDAALLKARSAKMRTIRATDSVLKKFRIAWSEAVHHLIPPITRLKPPASKPKSMILPGMVKQEYSADALSNLRAAATTQGGTLNDLFLCKMFKTVRAWNQGSGRNYRILVPSDMRDGQDFEIPACNMTACTFITRKGSEIDNDALLLDLIRQDTLKIKSGAPQKSFVNAITSAMEGSMMPLVMNRHNCLATSVLSNAGDPARRFTCKLPKKRGKVSCDEFTLESISGVPPLHRHTRSTLSVSIYGRRLTVSLRCDPHLFSLEESRRLLDLFGQQLEPDMQD